VPGSGCRASSVFSNVIVDALLSPPGVVGRLSRDVPDTAEGDLECRVVEGVIVSPLGCCVTIVSLVGLAQKQARKEGMHIP
jgi:hypothetical protein